MKKPMWLDSLLKVQNISSKEEWQKLDFLSKWIITARGSFFIMTLFSGLLAGIFACKAGRFDFGIWLLVTLGILAAHAVNNLLNDYTDHVRHIDDDIKGYRRSYAVHPLAAGYIKKGDFLLKYVGIPALVGIVVGLTLLHIRHYDGLIWTLFLFGALLVVFYTWPLKGLALGELAVCIAWGPLMIAGGYYVITQEWSNYVFFASLPYSLGVASVLIGAHLDKYSEYKKLRVKTLPVVIGEAKTRRLAVGMLVFPYVIVAILFLAGFFRFPVFIIFLAVPKALKAIKIYTSLRPTSSAEIEDPMLKQTWPFYYLIASTRYDKVFGPLYILAVLVDVLLFRYLF